MKLTMKAVFDKVPDHRVLSLSTYNLPITWHDGASNEVNVDITALETKNADKFNHWLMTFYYPEHQKFTKVDRRELMSEVYGRQHVWANCE